MEKFHYNPISVNQHTVKLFPNIETLNIYKNEDQYLKGGRIQRYIDWSGRSWKHARPGRSSWDPAGA